MTGRPAIVHIDASKCGVSFCIAQRPEGGTTPKLVKMKAKSFGAEWEKRIKKEDMDVWNRMVKQSKKSYSHYDPSGWFPG